MKSIIFDIILDSWIYLSMSLFKLDQDIFDVYTISNKVKISSVFN